MERTAVFGSFGELTLQTGRTEPGFSVVEGICTGFSCFRRGLHCGCWCWYRLTLCFLMFGLFNPFDVMNADHTGRAV
jgi:hypothetical protein